MAQLATRFGEQRRRRSSSAVAALAAAFAAVAAWGSFGVSFVTGRHPVVRDDPCASMVARRAVELEAPPPDEQLQDTGIGMPRPKGRRQYWDFSTPKRLVPGTLCFARRELNEEAARMKPYLMPLLEKQLSTKEITFVLNRMGAKLRHLLYRPRQGVPVFTPHKVRRLLRRAKDENGIRLIKYKRPQFLPPNAPGAPYTGFMKDVYAEVPPLKPWPAS